jgi:radical SAM superfamily enzyme YgiQ (UPF0313 family)
VVEDIARLKTDFQVETIFFTDSVFNDAGDLYLGVVEELLRKDVSIAWSAFFRPEKDMIHNMGLLKRSGLSAVEVGTDAASDETLAGINKPFCFEDVLSFSDACLQEDVPCIHYVMFGGPEETEQTIKKGLENLSLLEHAIILAFSGIRILPKTPLYEQALSEGVVRCDDSLLRPVFYFSPHVNVEHMNREIEASFRHKRQRIFPPSSGQAKLKALHGFGFEGSQWHALLSLNETRVRKRKQRAFS